MQFEADVDLWVDDIHAHLTGCGSTLVIETDEPVALARRMLAGRGGNPRRQSLRDTAEALASVGATLVVTGPTGRLASLGSDVVTRSRALRRLTGTTHLGFGPARGVIAALASSFRARRRRSAGSQ